MGVFVQGSGSVRIYCKKRHIITATVSRFAAKYRENSFMTKYYPVNLALEKKKCVVVGAGVVAERKVRRLLECGALVSVISPAITPGLKFLATNKKILFKNKKVNLKDLSGAFLVIAAASCRKINSFVSDYCRKKGILINVVDFPQECNFILPSIVTRGSLTISISTDGISPALAKKIRQDLEKKIGAEYAKLLRILKEIRPQAIRKIKSARRRKDFFQKAVHSGILELLRKNKQKEAREKILSYIQRDKKIAFLPRQRRGGDNFLPTPLTEKRFSVVS